MRLLALCLCLFVRLHAQSGDTATVNGTVLDVAGKGIPTAAVSVRNEANGSARQTTSGTDGRFSVIGLPVGVYSIEVTAPSFATSRRTGLKLAAGATENVSISLNVGELSRSEEHTSELQSLRHVVCR